MKTRRAFERKGRRMAFNFSMNMNAEEFHLNKTWGPGEGKDYKAKPNLSLEYSESYLNQRLGILLSASRANSYTEQYNFVNTYNRSPTAADPRPMVIRSIDFKDGPKFITKDALLLTADFKATPRLVLSFNAIYTYTEGAFWNRSFTFVAANDNSNVNNGRSRVTGDGMLTVGTQRTTANTVPTVNNGGGSSAKLTYTRTFAPKFEYKLRGWTFDGAASFSRSVNNYEALERGLPKEKGLPSPAIGSRADRIASRGNGPSARRPGPIGIISRTGRVAPGSKIPRANGRPKFGTASSTPSGCCPFCGNLPPRLSLAASGTRRAETIITRTLGIRGVTLGRVAT